MAKFDPFLSLHCARVEGIGAQSKEKKGSHFAAQRSGAIVQKPEGPNTHDSKNPTIAIWEHCMGNGLYIPALPSSSARQPNMWVTSSMQSSAPQPHLEHLIRVAALDIDSWKM